MTSAVPIEQAPPVVRQLHHYLGRHGRVFAGFEAEEATWSARRDSWPDHGRWRVFSWSWTNVTVEPPRGASSEAAEDPFGAQFEQRPALVDVVLSETYLLDGRSEFALEAPWLPMVVWHTTSSSEQNVREVVKISRLVAAAARSSWEG